MKGKEILMDIDTKIKTVLKDIKDNKFDEQKTLSEISRKELKDILLMSEHDDFLSHTSDKQKLVQEFIGGGFVLSPSVFVTRAGRQFIEDYDRTKSSVTQTFNIESVSHSSLGNYNTVNNYSETPIQDLKEYIDSIDDENRLKDEGKELVETLETEEVKPGYLAKFEDFLKEYPKTIDLISSFITSIAINAIT